VRLFRPVLLAAVAGLAASPRAAGAEARRMTVDDLLAIRRVSDAQVSPDGKLVAYAVREVSLEKNASVSHIWIVPATGGAPRRLTNGEKGEARPRWSPDGRTIAFLSSRSGSAQVWLIPVDGGEAAQLTRISTGADGHVWSPAGTHLAFTSDVWPGLEGGDAAQKKREEEIEASGIEAQVIDDLLYRHWSDWRRGKRTHVFVVPVEGGDARDATPGDFDAPPFSLGGPDAFAFSPDGKRLAFTQGPERSVEAWSTNADLFVVPVEGGEAACLTRENRGWDGSPAWSPDGRLIAYRSQAREGYESDRFRLAVVDPSTGRVSYAASDLDRSIDEILWSPDSRTIHFLVEDEGRTSLHAVPAPGQGGAQAARRILGGIHFSGLTMDRGGAVLAGEVQSLVRPAEVAVLDLAAAMRGGAEPRAITRENDALLAALDVPSSESVQYPGALGASIQAWLLKPPGWKAGARHPFILFVHGGPQSAWQDAFSYRWNPALYASRGYVVLLPNFHGSTGFGQAFTERISGDWAGAAYEDLMKGVDWAIAEGLADPERLTAMGGSFGGYMVNWILGHTDRFRALVSHAGVYNLESMYGATEELWFPEWDLGGTPWKNRGDYERFSPHRHAARFKTPTLVIHGELDYRVPVTEGFQLFTALRRQGIEARLLHFPDEGHWILKPKNAKLWNETVTAWLERFARP
jgi:dipeptidyl aminopeptidase/acylaminoacyl peptidase